MDEERLGRKRKLNVRTKPGPKPRAKDAAMNRNPEGAGGYAKGGPAGPGKGYRPGIGTSILADMKRAYTEGSKKGDPPGVVRAAKLLAEDYKGFTQMFVKLSEQEGGEGSEESRGPRADAARELCDQLLAELNREIG